MASGGPSRLSIGACVHLPPPTRCSSVPDKENRKDGKDNKKKPKKYVAGVPKKPPKAQPGVKPRESTKPSGKVSMNPMHTGRATFCILPDRRGSRSSLYGQSSSSQLKKDPRPLSEKAFMNQSTKRLHAFLMELGYSNQLKLDTLKGTSARQFCDIFNFLLEQIHPTMTITGTKLDEEVPRILTLLGYPFTIIRSSLKSIGCPHTWPSQFGLLLWLMEVVIIAKETKISEMRFPRELDYTNFFECCYHSFVILYNVFVLEGESEKFQRELDIVQTALRTRYDKAIGDRDELVAESAELKESLDILSMSKIPPLQEELSKKEDEKVTYAKWVEDVLLEVQKYKCRVLDFAEGIEALDGEIQASQAKVKELEGLIATQPLTAEEAEGLYDQRKVAEMTLEEQKQIGEEKVSMRNEVLMRYNEGLRELTTATKSINEKTHWVSSSLGIKFTVLDHRTKDGTVDIASIQNLNQQMTSLKNEFEEVITHLAGLIAACDRDSVTTEEAISEVHDENIKQQIQLNNGQSSFEIKQKEVERKEKMLEERMTSVASEKQYLEHKRNEINAESAAIQLQAKKHLHEWQTKYDAKKSELETKTRRQIATLKEVCAAALTFAKTQQNFVAESLEKVEHEKKVLRSTHFAKVPEHYLK